MKRTDFTLVVLFIATLVIPQVASASYSRSPHPKPSPKVNIKFASCPTPGGTQVAGHPEGWHWIVGESTLRWGSDYVYHQGNTKYVQCYCPLDGTKHGIQTNWLPASLVSDEKKADLISKGWILANGSDFGLEPVPFLAQNLDFKCKSPRPSPTPKPTPICETNVTQSNTTNAAQQINANSNSGLNTQSKNTGGSISAQTGEAKSQTAVDVGGGHNTAIIPAASESTGISIDISDNGASSSTTTNY